MAEEVVQIPVCQCVNAKFRDAEEGPDSPEWNICEPLVLVDTVTGLPPKEHTEVRACWSEDSLYIQFRCWDSFIRSDFTKRDEPLYEQDVVEVFIDEDASDSRYMELELSPHNVVFDAMIVNDRASGSGISVDFAWDATGLQTLVRPAEEGEGADWIYGFRLPWVNFSRKPVAGEQWKINFYRIDENPEGVRQFQAWSPTGAVNYHLPDRFGILHFQ